MRERTARRLLYVAGISALAAILACHPKTGVPAVDGCQNCTAENNLRKVGLVTPGPDFVLTVGDSNVPFAVPVYDQNGNPITLPSGTVVEFRYRIQTDLADGVENAGKVTGAAPGLATYVFQSADTTTPGFFNGQFVIELPIEDGGIDGSQQTFSYPQTRMLKIQVRAQP